MWRCFDKYAMGNGGRARRCGYQPPPTKPEFGSNLSPNSTEAIDKNAERDGQMNARSFSRWLFIKLMKADLGMAGSVLSAVNWRG